MTPTHLTDNPENSKSINNKGANIKGSFSRVRYKMARNISYESTAGYLRIFSYANGRCVSLVDTGEAEEKDES